MSLAKCDLSQAELVFTGSDGSGDICCESTVEAYADLKSYRFASKDGCKAGQRAAVNIDGVDV